MTIKAIIPCAGFGTRIKMLSHESKEMLIDPNNPDKYLIDYSLDLCYKYNIDPVVITRPEKQDLINYLKTKECELIICKPGKEWAETVLKSQGLWGDKNILLLPDTRFDVDALEKVIQLMHYNYKLVTAVHNISNTESDKWGTVTKDHIFEKWPRFSGNDEAKLLAWGILGFDKNIGVELFNSLYPCGFYKNNENIGMVYLDSFKDITRTGTLEKY
jgi:UTP-glucose-1-phosphate uridylyltransferase